MTTAQLDKKSTPEEIRIASIRVTGRRRGLNLMKRRDSWWILRDGRIIAGGPTGLTLTEIERLLRTRGALADEDALTKAG